MSDFQPGVFAHCTCIVMTGGHLVRSESCPLHFSTSQSHEEVFVPLSAIRALIQQWEKKRRRRISRTAWIEHARSSTTAPINCLPSAPLQRLRRRPDEKAGLVHATNQARDRRHE